MPGQTGILGLADGRSQMADDGWGLLLLLSIVLLIVLLILTSNSDLSADSSHRLVRRSSQSVGGSSLGAKAEDSAVAQALADRLAEAEH
jgi:hypothetical protein